MRPATDLSTPNAESAQFLRDAGYNHTRFSHSWLSKTASVHPAVLIYEKARDHGNRHSAGKAAQAA
jgi:hypothetical protein